MLILSDLPYDSVVNCQYLLPGRLQLVLSGFLLPGIFLYYSK